MRMALTLNFMLRIYDGTLRLVPPQHLIAYTVDPEFLNLNTASRVLLNIITLAHYILRIRIENRDGWNTKKIGWTRVPFLSIFITNLSMNSGVVLISVCV